MTKRAAQINWGHWGITAFCALCGALALSCSAADQSDDASDSTRESSAELSADPIEQFIYSRYAKTDVRHSFRTRFAEDVDCIDFAAQPSVRAGHAGPSPAQAPAPLALSVASSSDAFDDSLDEGGNRRGCPAGTVPFLRESRVNIAAAGGLDAYRTAKRAVRHDAAPPNGGCAVAPPALRCYANNRPPSYNYDIDDLEAGSPATEHFNNIGGKSTLAVYAPFIVANTQDHSISQIWTTVGCGTAAGPNCPGVPSNPVQSVEVGWTVDHSLNGDYVPHLFTFSTQDGYWATGCYNLESSCLTASGGLYSSTFVVVNSTYTPGMTLSYGTAPAAPPEIAVATQVSGGNWWININNVWIGYYPASSFNGQMLTAATYFSFGGELYDSEPGGHHTTAQMGDGTKPTTSGFGTTAYQRDFAYFNPCSGGVCWFRASGNDLYNISVYDSYPPLNGEDSFFGNSMTLPSGPGAGPYFYFGGQF